MSQYASVAARIEPRVSALAGVLAATSDRLADFARECVDRAPMGSLDYLPTSTELAMGVTSDATLSAVELALASAYCGVQDSYTRHDLHHAIEALTIDERLVFSAAWEASLTELGYEVERVDTDGVTMLCGTDGTATVAVEVADGAVVETDYAGCSEGACVPRHAELVEALTRHGVQLDMEQAQVRRHDDPDGGTLFDRWYALERTATVTRSRSAAQRRQRLSQGGGR